MASCGKEKRRWKRRWNNGASWGVGFRCGVPRPRRLPEGRRDPMDRPASAAALRSFVPPPRRGLSRVPFPARDGIDSQSQRGKGKGAGLEWKPDWEREPRRALGWVERWGGVMRVRWS